MYHSWVSLQKLGNLSAVSTEEKENTALHKLWRFYHKTKLQKTSTKWTYSKITCMAWSSEGVPVSLCHQHTCCKWAQVKVVAVIASHWKWLIMECCDSVIFLCGCFLHLCTSSMAGQGGGRYLPQTTVASVILILCILAQSFTCSSLQGLSKKVEQETAMEARTGSILFNGKALDSHFCLFNSHWKWGRTQYWHGPAWW